MLKINIDYKTLLCKVKDNYLKEINQFEEIM